MQLELLFLVYEMTSKRLSSSWWEIWGEYFVLHERNWILFSNKTLSGTFFLFALFSSRHRAASNVTAGQNDSSSKCTETRQISQPISSGGKWSTGSLRVGNVTVGNEQPRLQQCDKTSESMTWSWTSWTEETTQRSETVRAKAGNATFKDITAVNSRHCS